MDTIRSMVQRGGLLSATADDGTEFTFKMDRSGLIAVYREDEDGDEEDNDDDNVFDDEEEEAEARAREEAGADWMVEQGFDRKD